MRPLLRSGPPGPSTLLLGLLTLFIAGCGGGELTQEGELEEYADAESSLTGYGAVKGMGGNCLDASGRGTSNGTEIHMWRCHGGSNQQWKVGPVGSRGPIKIATGKCLDVAGGSTKNGAKVQLWSCHGGSNQQWTRTSEGTFVGVGGKCLDVWGYGTSNGTRVSIYTCHGGENQKWRVEGSTEPAPEVSTNKLTWAPPKLSNPTTIKISNANRSIRLEAGKDYILEFTEPVTRTGGVSVDGRGARHVVLKGGEIRIPWAGPYTSDSAFGRARRGFYVKNWSGTFHIEGLWIHGEDLAEGMDVDTRSPGAILQIQNVRIDNVHSRPEEIAVNWKGVHHPDIIQNWGGPTYYRIDRLTGDSDYQGLMMQPTQFSSAMATLLADFRRVNLRTSRGESGRYMLFHTGGMKEYRLEDVWLAPNKGIGAYPESLPAWSALRQGTPVDDFVPLGVAGMNYVSPGYAN